MVSDRMPFNRFDYTYNYRNKDFSGNSFLVNPYSLLANVKHYRPKEIAEYIALASFRNFVVYSTTGDTTLDLFHSPVGEDTINKNRLLSIKDGRIHFKYEEATKEKK